MDPNQSPQHNRIREPLDFSKPLRYSYADALRKGLDLHQHRRWTRNIRQQSGLDLHQQHGSLIRNGQLLDRQCVKYTDATTAGGGSNMKDSSTSKASNTKASTSKASNMKSASTSRTSKMKVSTSKGSNMKLPSTSKALNMKASTSKASNMKASEEEIKYNFLVAANRWNVLCEEEPSETRDQRQQSRPQSCQTCTTNKHLVSKEEETNLAPNLIERRSGAENCGKYVVVGLTSIALLMLLLWLWTH